jgi:hypothetical protein
MVWDYKRRPNIWKVATGLSMSLDGFIAGPNDGPGSPLGEGGERLFAWYSGGDTVYGLAWYRDGVPGLASERRDAPGGTQQNGGDGDGTQDVRHRQRVGRQPSLGVPAFVVVTHTVPNEWVYEGSRFTSVTDGVESAVEQAKAVAGDKDVAVGAASIAQQCIRAGLLGEIHVDLAPVLLGDGVRLFDHLSTGPIDPERARVVEAPG